MWKLCSVYSIVLSFSFEASEVCVASLRVSTEAEAGTGESCSSTWSCSVHVQRSRHVGCGGLMGGATTLLRPVLHRRRSELLTEVL